MESFEEILRKDLHQFLLSMQEVDERLWVGDGTSGMRLPECPDLLKLRWWDKSIEEIENLIPILSCGDLEKVKEELKTRL